jgi:hypothetical protein
LHLSTEQSWSLTPREMAALRRVREEHLSAEARRWAVARADYRNVHFRGQGHTQAWTAEEILGQRTESGSVEQELQRIQAMQLNMRQKRLPAALPAWARMTPEEEAQRRGLRPWQTK